MLSRKVLVPALVCALLAGGAGSAGAAPESKAAPPAKSAKAKKAAAAKKKAAARKKAAAAKKRAAARKQAATVAAAATAVRSLPVTFTVKNTNTSQVPCNADGRTYAVKGHITGPANRIADGSAAALYVHGLGYGEFFWNYKGKPGYDYAADQAQATGLVSVTIDRLGYGASGRPDGNLVCYGSEGDYLHQIAMQLKSGGYALDGAAPAKFAKVALVGHSAGGFMVEAAALYGGVDALVLAGFANTGISPLGLTQFAQTTLQCATNPKPGNYGDFGQTAADFEAAHIFNAEPDVAADVVARRAPDPCQDTGSAPQSILVDAISNNSIKVPVLIVNGANDALFPPPAGQEEKALFLGNPDVSQATIANAGHALTLGRTAPHFRAVVGDWLKGRGF